MLRSLPPGRICCHQPVPCDPATNRSCGNHHSALKTSLGPMGLVQTYYASCLHCLSGSPSSDVPQPTEEDILDIYTKKKMRNVRNY